MLSFDFRQWFRRLTRGPATPRASKQGRRTRPLLVEQLEDRLTPTIGFLNILGSVFFTSDDLPPTDSLTLKRDTSDDTLVYNAGAGDVDTGLVFGLALFGVTSISVDLANGTNSLTLDDTWNFAVPTGYTGGTGLDTITGNNNGNTFNVTGSNSGNVNDGGDAVSFTGVEILTGGSGGDAFNFLAAGTLGPGGFVDGAAGTDTLDFSAKTDQVNVSLTATSGTGFTGDADGAANPIDNAGADFSDIESIVGTGAAAADVLTGVDADSTWNVTGSNAGDYVSTNTLAWSSFEDLQGGAAADNFVFAAAGSLGAGPPEGFVGGGGGTDTLDFSAKADQVNVALTATSGTGFTGNADGTANPIDNSGSDFSDIESVVGSGAAAADQLAGLDAGSTWNITGGNSGDYVSTNTLAWSSFEALQGGTAADNFVFAAAGTLGAGPIDGFVNGGTGSDILDFSAKTDQVNVTLTATSGTGFTGNADGAANPIDNIGADFSDIESIVGTGAAAADQLAGLNAIATWNITGADAGDYVSTNTLTWTGFENLLGGSARDIFKFAAGSSLSGQINGGAGRNWLDYSALATSVIVRLNAGITSLVGGSVQNINNAMGSANGGDRLTGRLGGGVLVGHGSGNFLTAGSGRSILIGGQGRNVLVGGSAQDILINGRITFDNDIARLDEILDVWQDPLMTYNQRLTLLQAPLYVNRLKVGLTIFVFAAPNGGIGPRYGRGGFLYQSTLVGNGGRDWFITSSLSTVVDRALGEVVTTS